MDDRPPPWESALEAYRRAHPHREDDLDAAFASFDANAEPDPVAVEAPATPSPEPDPEQMPIEDVEWGSTRDSEEKWWQRL